MFEKYKNEDTENMDYFDILNTIDSELREFEKRMWFTFSFIWFIFVIYCII